MDSKWTERWLFHMELSRIFSFLADLPLADTLSGKSKCVKGLEEENLSVLTLCVLVFTLNAGGHPNFI